MFVAVYTTFKIKRLGLVSSSIMPSSWLISITPSPGSSFPSASVITSCL